MLSSRKLQVMRENQCITPSPVPLKAHHATLLATSLPVCRKPVLRDNSPMGSHSNCGM